MKRALLLMTAMMLVQALESIGQEQKSLAQDSTGVIQQRKPLTDQEKRRKQEQYFRRTIGGDSLKAVQVSKVMEEYKTALYRMMEDKSLSAEARKSKMTVLMETKNRKLSELLSPDQQSRLIPSTETTGRGLKRQTP